jgi:CYTH domain-containing protein
VNFAYFAGKFLWKRKTILSAQKVEKIDYGKIHTVKKYSKFENERRFLVSPDADWKSFIEPYYKTLKDKYIKNSRFRLRVMEDSDSERVIIKLTKKYESDSPFYRLISSTVLSPEEYELFNTLDGDSLKKTRHYHNFNGQMFAIDVFEGELDGLILCEAEALSFEDLTAIEFPEYAKYEVTEDAFFDGGNLCVTTQSELKSKLSNYDFK